MRPLLPILAGLLLIPAAVRAFEDTKPAETPAADAATESKPAEETPAKQETPAETAPAEEAASESKPEEAAAAAESNPAAPAARPAPMTPIEKASYQIGIQIGNDLKRNNLMMLNADQIANGIATILSDGKSVLSDEEVRAAYADLQKEVRRIIGSVATRNKLEGEKFLTENKDKPNIKVTESGLQYEVLREGTGAVPTASSTVSTHYRGRLISGKVFDESYKGPEPTAEDKPTSFPVNGVIAGWTEILQVMKVGAKYRLYIPSGLAYGEKGAGEDIGPNATLIFDIELVSID
ncbi:MAG: FKBP-type peptidyl-prolyl cis-trans isomerase [Planctomyces sp.]|jgi:FKBP-type peptidyl-prolyl cis-trans isomerase FklB